MKLAQSASVLTFAAAGILLSGAASANAASKTYLGSGGKWSVPSAWSGSSVPVAGDEVFVLSSGTKAISIDLNVTYGSPGLASLLLNSAGERTITLNASQNLTVSGTETIGSLGKAEFNQTKGTHTAGAIVLAASATTDRGTYTIRRGTLNIGGDLEVGAAGKGDFIQRGGTVRAGSDLVLGGAAGSEGSYTFGKGTLTVTGTSIVGNQGVATLTQSGRGKLTQDALVVAAQVDSKGTVALKNGTMTSSSVSVGAAGEGHFRQDGGTHNVGTNLVLGSSGTGHYEMSKGSLNVTGSLVLGEDGRGEFIQAGKSKVTATGGVMINDGSYLLADSTLTTGGITVGGTGSFITTGTATKIRLSGDFLMDDAAVVDLTAADLVVTKGSEVSLSVTGEVEDGLFLHQLSLEKDITLTLDGVAGNALVVDSINLGSNSQFQIASYIVGNGMNIYYNGNNFDNRYLLGLSYDLGNGGKLIPFYVDDPETGGTLSESSFAPTIGAVPEPSSAVLVLVGLGSWALRRRTR